jgi:hypothetical protein
VAPDVSCPNAQAIPSFSRFRNEEGPPCGSPSIVEPCSGESRATPLRRRGPLERQGSSSRMPANAAIDNETLDHLLSFTGLALAALGRPACFVSTWAEATAAGRCLAGHGCSPLIATNPRTLYSTVRSKTSSNATRCAGRAHRGNPETIITAGVCGSQPQVGCCRLGHFKLPIPVYPRSADAPGWHRISAFVPAPDSRK